MKIPYCPRCGDCKVLLAPVLNQNPPEAKPFEIDDLPVACSQCIWRGTWKDIIYRT